ncbi:EmrB/QacA family drug resistance transporter [Bacillus anthracis str. UR-1]|nr:EmrB/QacA family drug resistance transporter [Bacillus anthracis str. UR-1]
MVEKNNKLGFVVAGLLLGILMASMDNTIVVTAMGTIVGDLGGLENFVWVVSAIWSQKWQVCRFSVNYQICMVERDSLFLV